MVATPIGNLQDITLRAIETLRSCDVIACEDTRHTRILLSHLGIEKPVLSCRARNESFAAGKVLEVLADGKNVAYVSDAGTPGISDPGAILVAAVRQAGHKITAIPGASALTALVSVAGLPFKSLLFEGFLPQKGLKRQKRLMELLETGCAVVVYESPYRIIKLFEELFDVERQMRLDEKGKMVQTIVGREMTKLHEQLLTGSVVEVSRRLQTDVVIKGEFCVLMVITDKEAKN